VVHRRSGAFEYPPDFRQAVAPMRSKVYLTEFTPHFGSAPNSLHVSWWQSNRQFYR